MTYVNSTYIKTGTAHKHHLCLFIILAALLGACAPEEDIALPQRTLLVWLAGDNNLSGETDEKLENIARGWDGTGGNIVVYQDRQDEAPRLLQLFANGEYRTLHTYAPQNSASRQVWGEVMREALAACPAQSYGLLFFSHATGWLPKGNYPEPKLKAANLAISAKPAATVVTSLPSTRTIGVDNTDEMELADFAAAIPDGQFRFIIFEACLMGGIEVAYELRHKTDYLLVSSAEILSPGFTDLYPRLIPTLFHEPVDNGSTDRDHTFNDPDEIRLAHFARTYYEAWDARTGYARSATVSVVRTAALEALTEAARPLMNNATEVSPYEVTYFDSTSPRLYSDLGDYLRRKSPSAEAYLPVDEALRSAVIYSAATPQVMGHPCATHTGLTLYLPRPDFPLLNAAWQQTAWARAIGEPNESIHPNQNRKHE